MKLGVPVDAPKAVALYRTSAATDPFSALQLAELLRRGATGVEKNPAEAMKWYRVVAGSDALP